VDRRIAHDDLQLSFARPPGSPTGQPATAVDDVQARQYEPRRGYDEARTHLDRPTRRLAANGDDSRCSRVAEPPENGVSVARPSDGTEHCHRRPNGHPHRPSHRGTFRSRTIQAIARRGSLAQCVDQHRSIVFYYCHFLYWFLSLSGMTHCNAVESLRPVVVTSYPFLVGFNGTDVQHRSSSTASPPSARTSIMRRRPPCSIGQVDAGGHHGGTCQQRRRHRFPENEEAQRHGADRYEVDEQRRP